jgi:uncharacterized protein YfaS (alpha-2-macroglobulin family)
MTEYHQGQTVSRRYQFKDKNGALFDPNSASVKIYNPSGVLVTTVSLTKITVGVYELNYNLAEDAPIGVWILFLLATKGIYVEKRDDPFEVIATR